MRTFEPLPQSQNDWLATGNFNLEFIDVAGHTLRTAVVERQPDTQDNGLVVMAGGIPRDHEVRQRLPTINKLYAKLALNLASDGFTSVLYNQPGTGESTGDFDEITFGERIKALVELTDHYAEAHETAKVSIVGTSAGAYMAARALDDISARGLNINSLVLQSPAAYPEHVEDLPYDERFTEAIRSDWDARESLVFGDIERYVRARGRLAIAFFQEDDPPIPRHIQDLFADTAQHIADAGDITQITYRGVAHNFRRIGHDAKSKRHIIDDRSVFAAADMLADFIAG
jgi:pimeloyl-ACP methyl ester carboxylesterase